MTRFWIFALHSVNTNEAYIAVVRSVVGVQNEVVTVNTMLAHSFQTFMKTFCKMTRNVSRPTASVKSAST